MVELLLQKIGVGSSLSCVRSTRSLLNHIVWHATKVDATYSASANDKDTMGCFVDAHETKFVPN